MRSRVGPTIVAFLTVACARDNSITHGADGSREWEQRLAAAFPVGTIADSARSTMERNGVRCSVAVDRATALWCDKESGGRIAFVRRRWIASFTIQNGEVSAIKATTGLVGL